MDNKRKLILIGSTAVLAAASLFLQSYFTAISDNGDVLIVELSASELPVSIGLSLFR